MRELYSKRLVHVIKDFKDQPVGRYNVFVHDVFGDKVVITCDQVDVTPVAIVCKRESDKLTDKSGVMVAVIPARDIGWGIIENARVIHMTGEEWEQHKFDESKDQLELYTRLNNGEKIVKVAITPDGRQFRLPIETGEAEAVRVKESQKDTSVEPDSNAQYGVPRSHI